MGRGRRRGRRRRRERQTALKRKVELVNRHSSSLPHTSLTITPCTPHTYTHILTSSHPHTSLCHPLIFHILTTHTPSPPHTLTHHSITPCIPHTYNTHTLTSSHPYTSLCHPLIFHIPTTLTSSHPHIFTCMYNNTMYHTHLSHSVDHLHLLTLTPHPHTPHTFTPSFRCFSKRK